MTRKSLSEAISSSVINTPKIRLYNEALKRLRSSDNKPLRAHDSFMEAVWKDPELLAEAMGITRQMVFNRTIEYLRERSAEIDGSAVAEAATGSGVLESHDTQKADAPAASTKTGSNAGAGEAGHRAGGFHHDKLARSPASSTPPKAVGGGQGPSDSHATVASPSIPAWTKGDIPVREHTRKPPAKAFPLPRVPMDRQLAAHNRHADSILITLKVRGRPIGQWTGEEAMAQSETSMWESRVLKVFAQGIPPNSKIGDILDEEEANRRWKWVESSSAA